MKQCKNQSLKSKNITMYCKEGYFKLHCINGGCFKQTKDL